MRSHIKLHQMLRCETNRAPGREAQSTPKAQTRIRSVSAQVEQNEQVFADGKPVSAKHTANSGDWKFEVRDRPANWPRADHFRRSPISTAAKAGGMRAFAPVMTKSPISGNAWLTTQSRRTGLGSRITLVTGKILENRAEKAKSAPKYRSLVSGLRIKFPTPPNREFIRGEQGIVFAEQRSERRL